MLVREALSQGPASLRELASDSGVPYQTMRTWASGLRTPSPENIRKLAEGFRRRAKRMREIADRLERAAVED